MSVITSAIGVLLHARLLLTSLLFGGALLVAALLAFPDPGGAASDIAVQVAAGGGHTCFLTDAGTVKCVGNNYEGQLGDGTTNRSTVPVEVLGMTSGVDQVAAGAFLSSNSCAIKSGALFCWGGNEFGQLGTGDTSASYVPVAFQGLGEVSEVSIGGDYICSHLKDGSVWCAGYNPAGQLGTGDLTGPDSCNTIACSKVAVKVAGLPPHVIALAAGTFSACALDDQGHVFCWGNNNNGQLGTGDNTGPESCGGAPCSRSPVEVVGLPSTVTAIAVGTEQACAVAGGDAYCWGGNTFYETAPATNNECHCILTPTKMGGVQDVKSVAAGAIHNCFLTSTNEAYCVGANNRGQLGAGHTGAEPCYCEKTPQKVVGVSTVASLSARGDETCVVTPSGTALCTGDDTVGQLGDDTLGDPGCHCRYSLTAVVDFGGVKVCSVSALQADGSPTPTPICPTIPPSPTPFGGLRGDVDCNSILDASDPLLALKIAAGIAPKPLPRFGCLDPGDMNCDYKVDVTDAIDIFRLVIGGLRGSNEPTPAPCGK